MKVLDLIRYICLHPEYTIIVFDVEDEYTPLNAILHLASIDPSYGALRRARIRSTNFQITTKDD